MRSSLKNEIFELPRTLRETLEKGRREYDSLLRRAPWGDEVPIIFVGSATTLPLAEFMAAAFERLVEWPCVVQAASEQSPEAIARITPKTIHFLISNGSESDELVNVAKAVRSRNGFVLALAPTREDPLARVADGVFAPCTDEAPGTIRLSIHQQAIAGYVPLLAARALKRPRPEFDTLEKEFAQLPSHLDRAFSQQGEGVRSLAREISHAKSLTIVGGGSYHLSAVHGVEHLRKLAGIAARAWRVTEDPASQRAPLADEFSFLVLTGSRSRTRKPVQTYVRSVAKAGGTAFSVTDGNDPEVSRGSRMTLLLPPLHEITGSTLAHVFVAWIAYEASRQSLVDRKPSK